MQQKLPYHLTILFTIATLLIGCQVNQKTMGEKLDDTTLLTNVNLALAADKKVRSSVIKVQVDRGIVQLSGFVESQPQAERAEADILKVEGVKGVVNNLIVKSSARYKSKRKAIAT